MDLGEPEAVVEESNTEEVAEPEVQEVAAEEPTPVAPVVAPQALQQESIQLIQT